MSQPLYAAVLHFPDGTERSLDMTYACAELRVGEKIVIERGPAYIITDVQHQFRATETGLKLILTNVILADWTP